MRQWLFENKTLQWLGIYVMNFLKWLMMATVIGIIGGLVGTLFHECIEKVTVFRQGHGWMIYLLPFAGLLIVFLYHRAEIRNDRGTNLVLDSVHTKQHVPFRMAPLIFVGTVLTHLCGGSAGREGAALQIGGSIGSTLGALVRFDEKDRHVLVMCGMSAVFAAMFGTPLTAAIFSMEVVSVGIVYYSAFVPCIISATVAYGLTSYMGVNATRYTINIAYTLSPVICLKVIGLAMLCGLVGILFCVALHQTAHFAKEKLQNDYVRVFVGGVLIILLTLFVGNDAYNGAGTAMIQRALHGEVPPTAFLWKIVFTAITIGTGYKGGEIVPTLFIGATFGSFAGPLLGIDPSYAAALCMVAMFCAVVNCPIASVLLGLEMFGRTDMLLFAIACGVSYVFSGYYSLYSSQKILYAKTRPEYINKKAK
ncbi:MAG: chloride channel protein [Clostridiales bacterium]|nr:chloride channel protein [Clostridiales bacterium]